jgi:hypothetical protein
MHTVCVTDDPLATYKLHARTFGGKTDDDLHSRHENVVTTQKWVNLMDIILDEFKGKGHCVTMDSAYMGDIMAHGADRSRGVAAQHGWYVKIK